MKFIVDEMPNCCFNCLCSSVHRTRPECNFLGTLNKDDWTTQRDKNCPLVEFDLNNISGKKKEE